MATEVSDVQVVGKPVEQKAPEQDLITKVTQFKKAEPPATGENQNQNAVDINFDYKELEGIKDPIARDIAMKAYKSMQAGATRKFQEVSALKKEAEELKRSVEQKMIEMSNWTPERIQKELLNNPGFLEAAQQVSGVKNVESESLLSEEDRAKINGLENELKVLKQTNYNSIIAQEDASLQSKFADYSPSKVNDALASLASMPPHKLREWIYKAVYHDDHVKSSYEMALQESRKINQEKISAFSIEGNQADVDMNTPSKQKGESDVDFFVRLAKSRKAQLQK